MGRGKTRKGGTQGKPYGVLKNLLRTLSMSRRKGPVCFYLFGSLAAALEEMVTAFVGEMRLVPSRKRNHKCRVKYSIAHQFKPKPRVAIP